MPIAAVKGDIASTFVALRRQIQQMPARHVAEMAAKLGCDAGALHGELDRMIHDTLSEMSAPTNADELTMELDDSDGQIELPRMGATVTAALGWDDTGAVVPFAGTVDTASSNGEGKKHGHHGGGHHSGSTSTYVPATSGSVAGSQHSAGGRGKGRTLTISAKSADMTGKLKEQRSAHMDNATFGDVAQAWGKKAGLTVQVDSALSSVNRPYWSMARESFMTWGERMAQQLDATFTIYNGTAAFTPRADGTSASGQSLTSIDVAWGIDLLEWSIAPVLSRPDDGTFQTRWYDVVAATHEVETADGTTGKSPATHSHRRGPGERVGHPGRCRWDRPDLGRDALPEPSLRRHHASGAETARGRGRNGQKCGEREGRLIEAVNLRAWCAADTGGLRLRSALNGARPSLRV